MLGQWLRLPSLVQWRMTNDETSHRNRLSLESISYQFSCLSVCLPAFLSLGGQLSNAAGVKHQHHQTLTLDRLLFLTAFYTVFLKPFFCQSLSLHSHLPLVQAHLLDFDHSVFPNNWRR